MIIEVRDLRYRYAPKLEALAGISLGIEAGEKVAFLGANGAGKSTLFLHLNGLLRPTAGTVLYRGRELKYDKRSLAKLRQRVGVVLQDPDAQLFSASIEEDISFGPINLGLPDAEVVSRVDGAIQRTGLEDLRHRPVHGLSLGEKKRVAIAGVLAMDPSILVLDEPTAFLDPEAKGRVISLLDEVNEEGATVIIATHDVDLACAWADRVFVLSKGRLISQGPVPEVFYQDWSEPGQRLAGESGLSPSWQRPWVLEVFERLVEEGLLPGADGPAPTSREGLLRRIAAAKEDQF